MLVMNQIVCAIYNQHPVICTIDVERMLRSTKCQKEMCETKEKNL